MIMMIAAMAAGCGNSATQSVSQSDTLAVTDSLDQLYETDVFTTESGKLVKIHALMHASICIEYDGKMIFVDPVAKLHERTVDYSVLPKADMILVTHEHFDHFDTATLKQLYTLKTEEVVMNKRCAGMFGPGGAYDNGDKFVFNGNADTVEAVPAYNYSEGRTQFHPKCRDNGFILTIDGLRIYIAGDTEDIPEMFFIQDIDVAFLPVNQPYTMTVEQCVNAAKTIGPKVLIPYHFSQTDISSLPELLPGIEVRLMDMQ